MGVLRLLAALVIFLFFVGIMYLYLVPFSNFISMQLFADSVCVDYPWKSCSSVLFDNNGYKVSDGDGFCTFFGFLVSFSVFAPIVLIITLFVWNCLMDVLVLDDWKLRFRIFHTIVGSALWMWFFFCLNSGLFFAKEFTAVAGICNVTYIPTTTPYGYSIEIPDGPDFKRINYDGFCAPLKYLGYNQGVQMIRTENNNFYPGCSDCVLKGFWIIFLTGTGVVAIPLFIFFIIKLIIRRWNISKAIVQDANETDRLLN
jgi:hypothetical protein